MKRVAVIAIFLAVMASLFAFPGYATTYNPNTYNSYTDAVTYNGVTYNVRVTQLKALSEGTSLLPGGMETIMLVTLQMTNNTSSVKAATIPKLSIDISDERVITDVFTYGGDFTLGLITGGIGIFYPGSDFSLDNNKVVVPPNKSLYCVGAIGLPAQLNQTGDGTLDTGLRGVHLYDKSNYCVTDGDYSFGNPIDVSPIINLIESIIDNQDIINENLEDIIAALTYTGNNPSFSLTGINNNSVYKNIDHVTVNAYRFVSNPYLINSDVEILEGTDTYYQYGTKRYDITLVVQETASDNVLVSPYVIVNNFIPTEYKNLVVDAIYSDSLEYYSGLSSRLNLYRRNTTIVYNRYILNKGLHYHIVKCHIDVPYDTNLTFASMNLDNWITDYGITDIYAPVNEYMILRDLYNAYSQVNGLDDIDDTADEIKDKSESAHTQEQSYFTQNAQAIQQTGLSNYRFNGDQENGIGSVSHDFTLLWNALGGFNSVYIFSLTLSLALMILRHAPGAIKSSRRNKEE